MQWTITPLQGATVLAVNGFIAAHHVDRLCGAIGWTDRRSSGPVVVDLTAVQGWSLEGEHALGAALGSWRGDGRRIIVCVPAGSPLDIADPAMAELDRCEDVRDALTTCRA
jgi:anti-anti-sigma regulatory factor